MTTSWKLGAYTLDVWERVLKSSRWPENYGMFIVVFTWWLVSHEECVFNQQSVSLARVWRDLFTSEECALFGRFWPTSNTASKQTVFLSLDLINVEVMRPKCLANNLIYRYRTMHFLLISCQYYANILPISSQRVPSFLLGLTLPH